MTQNRRLLPNFLSKKRFIVFIVIIAIAISGLIFVLPDESDTESQSPTLPYADQPELPAFSDLAPDAVDLSSDRVFPSLTYGIQTFFWWDVAYRQFGLTQINLMEFSHIRQDFAWLDIEPHQLDENDPDRYIWHQADAMMLDIEDKGAAVIARLNKPPEWAIRHDAAYEEPPFDMDRLANYCGAVASRYQGRIQAYQIWNEPNLSREWANLTPSPKAYVDLLIGCSTAIREVDPNALIISAGLAPTGNRDFTAMPHDEFLWRMYDAGASPYFDLLGVHAPGYLFEPEQDPDELVEKGYLYWQCFRHVEYMRGLMVERGDAHKQIAITEMGWTIDPRTDDTTYSWFAVTPEQQGEYLAQAYQFAAENWRPWIGPMVTIYYPNVAWTENDEEYWWAIGTVAPFPFGMDGRPAWAALVQMEKISTNPDYAHAARDAFGNRIDDE